MNTDSKIKLTRNQLFFLLSFVTFIAVHNWNYPSIVCSCIEQTGLGIVTLTLNLVCRLHSTYYKLNTKILESTTINLCALIKMQKKNRPYKIHGSWCSYNNKIYLCRIKGTFISRYIKKKLEKEKCIKICNTTPITHYSYNKTLISNPVDNILSYIHTTTTTST